MKAGIKIEKIEKIDQGNYVRAYEQKHQRGPFETMTSETPETTTRDFSNAGTTAAIGKNDHYDKCSQTGEEFSREFIRDRIGVKRVTVMPNVDHFLQKGGVSDFKKDQQLSSHYEDGRSPFNYERRNMDCGISGSTYCNSPIVRNPVRNPFGYDQRSTSGHCYDETSPWEATSDPIAALLNFSESPQSYKLKFLCSYGGRILPRPSDGKLRYVGGETRIISIRRNVTWEELVRKTSAICNQPHTIKYQLPGEDLDALISVCSDEDLQHMIEEYGELEQNGNSQRLRMFLVSLSECDSPSSFEVRSEQQQDVDYQYVVAVNGIFDPSPQKSMKVGNHAVQLGGNSSDYSPGCQRDSPTFSQAIDMRDYSPSNTRMTPRVLMATPRMHNDVLGSSPSKAFCDKSYYYCGDDSNSSTTPKLPVLSNHSIEDSPMSRQRSIRLHDRNPSSQDDNLILAMTFEEKGLAPLENILCYSDDPGSWFARSMETDIPHYRMMHVLSDSNLQGQNNGYTNSTEGEIVTCPVNVSAENVPLLAFSSPSQEWYMKSQDITKEDSCNARKVISTDVAGTFDGDQGGILSPMNAKVKDYFQDKWEGSKEVSADVVLESNGRSYVVGIPLKEPVEKAASDITSIVNQSKMADEVFSHLISETTSGIEEGCSETKTKNVGCYNDPKIGSKPENGNSSLHEVREDQGTITPLIVEDVSEKVPEDIPTSSKVTPHVEDDPEPSESKSIISSTREGSITPDTDYEDVKSDDQDDGEDPISDAAMAEIEAGIYGLQIIKNADLEELRELGSGTFGTVYHGKWRGTDVAIKRIKKSCFAGRLSEQERITKDFWREAKILSNLHHPNVVAFYGVVPDGPGGTLATVTEFMVNGSLRHNLLRNNRLLDRRKKVMIAMDAAFGMEYLHLKNIVHFDLKCDNLLVNLKDPRRPICKVADFGLSRIKQNTLVSGGIRGTLPWMAPELLNGTNNRVSEKVDIYSFGIAMWEMLTGEEPYANMHCGAIIGGIVNNNLRPPIPEKCDSEWQRLMEQCWSADPSHRPSFTEVTQRLQDMLKTLQMKRYPSDKSK